MEPDSLFVMRHHIRFLLFVMAVIYLFHHGCFPAWWRWPILWIWPHFCV